MGYISKYDTKFITFINRKYKTSFDYFDDYGLWLYDKFVNDEEYYCQLEKDIIEYSNFQTGLPKDKIRKRGRT